MRSRPVRPDARKTTHSRGQAKRRDVRRRTGLIPFLETLEGRVVLSTATWTGQDYAASDNWSDPGNWVDGYVPHSGDDVVFPDNAVSDDPINDNSPGMSLASITIQSGEYDLTGSSVVITGLLHANYSGDESLYEMSTQFSGGQIEVDGGGTLYVTGTISGSAGLEMLGTGTLVLRGDSANTYTGTTTVDSGTLTLDNLPGRYAIPGDLVIGANGAGATVHDNLSDQMNPVGSTLTINNNSTFNLDGGQESIGALDLEGDASIYTYNTDDSLSGLLTLGGTVTVASASATPTINGVLNLGASDRTFDVTGSLSVQAIVEGTLALNKTGTGIVTLNNAYDDPGAVNIENGTLYLQASAYDSSSTAGITVSSGATLEVESTGTMTEPVSIAGDGYDGAGAIDSVYGFTTFSNVTLTANTTVSAVSGLPLSGLVFSGAIGDGGNDYSFTAAGTGQIYLQGDNTYTGGTFVTGGLLYVSGSVMGTSTAEAGGELGGDGSLGDVVTNGGIVGAGGLSIFDSDIASMSSLTLDPTGTFQAQLDGPDPGTGYDQVIVSGGVVLNNANLSLPAFTSSNAFVPGSSITLISGATSLMGTFNGINNGDVIQADGASFQLFYDGGAGNDVVLYRIVNTTTTLTIPTSSSVYSQPVTLTATVAATVAGGTPPPGTVTFFQGSTNLGTATLDGSGIATLTTTALPVGNDPITATYNGAPYYTTSTASPVTQQVFQDTTTTTVTSSGSPSVYGQSVTIYATVTANSPGTGLGDGTVIIYDGTTPVASGVPLVAGVASFTSSSLTVGVHNFSAAYSGSASYIQSYSSSASPLVQTVDQAPTATALVSSGASVFGESVTLTATVSVPAPGSGVPTGTVTFYFGATVLGTGTLDGSGDATICTTVLPVGCDTITASYSGDTNYESSDATSIMQKVTQASSTVSDPSSSESESVYGESVTFSVTVTATAPGSGLPTGTVDFYDGATLLGTGTLDGSGDATYTTSTLSVGTHCITASYSGDDNFAAGESGMTTQIVDQADTTTVVVSSDLAPVYGEAITLTATVAAVSPGAGLPTGTVDFYVGETLLGTGTLDGSGDATFTTTSALAEGSSCITAVYEGDDNFITSTSPMMAVAVGQDTTTATVSPMDPAVYGDTVTLTVTVTADSPGSGVPTGTVKFYDGSTFLGCEPLDGSGVATLPVSDLEVGTHTITAVYEGDTDFMGSTATAVSLDITQQATTTTLSPSTGPTVFGQSVMFTATVAGVTVGAESPTGTVTFYFGATVLGTGTLNGSGEATICTTVLPVGCDTITASYSGDTNYESSDATSIMQKVTQAASTVSDPSSSESESVYGESVTFTVTVTATAPGAGLPTGMVNLYDGATWLACETLDGTGTATFTTSDLSVGTHCITASYSGDDNFAAGESGMTTQIVDQADTTTVVVSSDLAPVYGEAITLTATVAAVSPGAGLPTGTVDFYVGETLLGTGTLDGSGDATFTTTSALAEGSSCITAVYEGDDNFITSTSPMMAVAVGQDTTTATVSPLDPAVYGDTVTLTVTVTADSPGSGVPTGTVKFYDGSTFLGCEPLDGSGVATLPVSDLEVGTHTITAVYEGDTDFMGSTATAVSLDITQQATTTTLSPSTGPTVFGQSVMFTATVAGVTVGADSPTGTVTFYYGATVLGTGTLDGSGDATICTTVLPVGCDTITASYSGDTNYESSDATSIMQKVTQASSTVSDPSSSESESVYGESVTFSVTVTATAPGSGLPTGTVDFYDGATLLGTGTLDGSGDATYTTSTLSVGTHCITASYSGDDNFAAGESGMTTQIVDQADTTTVVVSSDLAPVYGEAITLTATVAAVSPGAGLPTGTVDFYVGETLLGTGTLDGSGDATFTTTSALAEGSSCITAVYEGDDNFITSTSPMMAVAVGQDTTTATVSPLDPAVYGDTVTLTVTVTADSPGSGVPTGTVKFYDGSTFLGCEPLDGSGVATLPVSDLEVGTHCIRAVYEGDTDFVCSRATAVSLDVTQQATTTTLSPSTGPTVFGQSVMFTATVAGVTVGAESPTGTVTFYFGATVLGTGTLNGSGEATICTTVLPVGCDTITASYSGDTNYESSDATSIMQKVTQASSTVSDPSSSESESVYGESVTFTVTVTATAPGSGLPTGMVNFYDGATWLACETLDGTGTATFTTSDLSVGTHCITASYSGDDNFAAGESGMTTQIVDQADTTTVVVSSDLAPVYGEAITLTATVAAVSPGAGLPTGTVDFYVGETLLGTGTLDGSGDATFTTTSALAEGSSCITAVYEGDDNFITSTSPMMAVAVGQDTTTATVSPMDPAVYGDTVTLTVTVTADSPGSGVPTGTVKFYDGSTFLGCEPLDGSGVATLPVSDLEVGTHTITAVYEGDTDFMGSTATAVSLDITQQATTTTLSPSTGPTVFGQSVMFTATVAGVTVGAESPTGTVTFYFGATVLGTGTLNGSGEATICTTVLPVGCDTITASYSGDTNYESSDATSIMQKVTQASSTVSDPSSSESESVYGESVTFTVTVTATAPGSGLPTGMVNFYDGATWLACETLDGTGTATFTTSDLSVGTHCITASYSGDDNFAAGESGMTTQIVDQADTTTVVVSSDLAPVYGEAITLTATVAAVSPGAGLPTGTVDFYVGETLLGTGTLDGSGDATFTTTSALAEGSSCITAVYEGDDNFITSTSPMMAVAVGQDTTTATVSPLDPAVYGDTVTLTVTVTADSPGSGVPTGTVKFYDGSTFLGCEPLDGSGVATLPVSDLEVGTHCIRAVYEGDTDFVCSRATAVSLDVTQQATTTTLSPSTGPTVFGQSVMFTATVAGVTVGAESPTGTVTFYFGATVLGTGTLNGSGEATICTTVLPVGCDTITASYSGDTNYESSDATSIMQKVTQASSTVSDPSSSESESVYGESVTFTVTVTATAPGSGLPTGMVNFYDGATWLACETLDGTGTATFTTSDLSVGTHCITASYSGDDNFASGESGMTTQIVDQADTTTVVVSSDLAPVYGEAITLTATVAAVSPGAGLPTGTVDFYVGETLLGTGTLDGSGDATFTTTSALAEGSSCITAVYEGDDNFITSTSPMMAVAVGQDTTTATVSPLDPAVYGDTVTLTVTVTADSPGSGVPTGTVKFYDGSTFLGCEPLDGSGVATLPVSDLEVGTHCIRAVYEGDTDFVCSRATAVSLDVTQQATTTTLSPSTGPTVFGQSVMFTATVAGVTVGAESPTGTVTFYFGATVLGTGTLNGSGEATICTTVLPVGCDTITASYSGDTNYESSDATSIMQKVTQASSTVSDPSSSESESVYGESVTFTVTVTATAPGSGLPTGMVNFYDGATWLACETLDGTGTATFTTSDLSVGTHCITASYSGDDNFASGESGMTTQIVDQADTTTVVVSSDLAPVYGEAITLTATVAAVSPGAGLPAGTVDFYDGATLLGTGTLDGSGDATFTTTSALAEGSSCITAVYEGDDNFITSTSPMMAVAVGQDTTTATVSPLDPAVYGDTVTLTVTVTADSPGSGVPTGTVDFYDGDTLLGTGTLDGSGEATFPESDLVVGTHTITAVYEGDTDFMGSTATAVSLDITQQATTTTLSPSTGPTVFGQSVMFTATVAGVSGGTDLPTGTVTFYYGAIVLGTGTLDGSAEATISTSVLPVGCDTITASYSGDTNYESSDATSIMQKVTQASSTVSDPSSSESESVYGESVTFTVTVTATAPGAGLPTGTVDFYDGATLLGTGTLDGSGNATYSTAALGVGTHEITAVYEGDDNFATGDSDETTQTVDQADTTTVAVSSDLSPAYGEAMTLTATVTVNSPGAGLPTGTVDFYDGATLLGTGTLDGSGEAMFTTTSALDYGAHTITAVYEGDDNFNTSTSTGISVVVGQDSTTATVSPMDPAAYGDTVTITVTVTADAPGSGTPTGTVNFFDDGTEIGREGLDSYGVATYTMSEVSVGTHEITALYKGDTDFAISTAPAVPLDVTQQATTTTLSPSTGPTVFGQSVMFTATVAGVSGGTDLPTGTVTFYYGATELGTGTLDGSAEATISTSVLPVGCDTITASYSGDTNYESSDATSIMQKVTQASSTVSDPSSSESVSVYGESVTFSVTVTATAPGAGLPTGTVDVYDGATLLGTGTLDGSGNATYSTAALGVGTHEITAVYEGDDNFATGDSGDTTQTVDQADTTTGVVSSDVAPAFGEAITLTATVAAVSPGAGLPTGTVDFYDGETLLGTGTLDGSGNATFTTTVLGDGSHTITAVYEGDENFSTSTSTGISVVVGQDTTTATVSPLDPAVYGQTVTLTVTVTADSPGSGVPTGTVEFYDGETLLGTGTLDGTGEATLPVSDFVAGTQTITAVYEGDTDFTSSTASAVSLDVNSAATSVSVPNSSSVASVFGQSVTFTVTVAATLPGAGIPSGTVTFYDGEFVLGTAELTGLGVASFTTAALDLGTHSITASYDGSDDFLASVSLPLSQTVTQAATSVTAPTSSDATSVYGELVTFTATVTATDPGTGVPSGTVTFYDGMTALGMATLDGSGEASFSTLALDLGSHQITASFNGDADFLTSTSLATNQTVGQTATTLTVASSLTPALVGQLITFTATVAVTAPGSGVPTGTVSFFDGMTLLGTADVDGSGVASLSISSLGAATDSITASYSGDTDFLNSISAPITQSVIAADTTTTLSSTGSPTVFGQSLTLTATVTVNVPAVGTASGIVDFYAGTTLLGSSSLDGMGVAVLTTTEAPVGSDVITSVYEGSVNFLTSTSLAVTHVVAQSSATTNVSSAGPTVFGQANTFTATVQPVAPGAGTPTGEVLFEDGSTVIGGDFLDGSGVATLTISGLAAGTHVITAVYSGDPDFSGATSNTLSQVVNQDPTVASVGSSANPAEAGQSVTLTASVASTSPGSGVPTGTVSFVDGVTVLQSGVALVDGIATYTFTPAAGPHSITVVCSGDSNFSGVTSPALLQVVNGAGQAATAATITSSPNPSVFGQTVTLTGTVATVPPSDSTPTGTVSFMDGTTDLGDVMLSGGVATLDVGTLAVGGHTIELVYYGDGNDAPSTSASIGQSVTQDSSTATLSASANPAVVGEPVTFTATIAAALPGSGTATGSVVFMDGSTVLGVAFLNGSGMAALTVPGLSIGQHSITAVYSGDANFLGGTSNAYSESVNQVPSTAGTITTSAPQTFYGENVTLTATFAASSDASAPMTGTVAFYDGTQYLGSAPITPSGSTQAAAFLSSFAPTDAPASGYASLSTTELTVGDHSITAIYSGDTNYEGAASVTEVSVQVHPATTDTTLASTTDGEGTTLTAHVVVTSPGDPPIVGTVSFFDGTTLLGTVAVTDGIATLHVNSLSAGSHVFAAAFSGGSSSSAFVGSAGSSASGTIAAIATGGPRIKSVQRYGYHAQATSLVITFNMPITSASAANVANYKIVGTEGHRIKIKSVVYDAATNQVKLKPADRLSIHHKYTLTIKGTGFSGVAGSNGAMLNASAVGESGADYVVVLTWRNLSGSAHDSPTLARVKALAKGVASHAKATLGFRGRHG